MPMYLSISHPTGKIGGRIPLTGSKSISNRVLIMRALSGMQTPIQRLAIAKDTQLLESLLQAPGGVMDAGAAGTTFRFLTAFLSLQEGTQTLTGTERMKQRPVGVLVEALKQLGARIEYLEKEGFPPLRIGPPDDLGKSRNLAISAGTSSQYISALLMIAPVLPQGLILRLEGKIVSRPYIEMTLGLMAQFGIEYAWQGREIHIPPQAYQPKPFTVEADWSAASYYYSLAALAPSADLFLEGLFSSSIQGDAVLPELFEPLGVYTQFEPDGIRITKSSRAKEQAFRYDFVRCPDLAQTMAVTCAGLGIHGQFHGVETLRIKETDRIDALKHELAKVEVHLVPSSENGEESFSVEGQARWAQAPLIHTYEDHRMAMAFAPLALYAPLHIADPEVVSKSYPAFWEDLASLGFVINKYA